MNKKMPTPFTNYDNFPLVSIITPTLYRSNFFEKTTQSVLTPKYPHLEFIVIDDCSTKNTQEVVEKNTDKLYYEDLLNMGETATVNKCFRIDYGDIHIVVNSEGVIIKNAISNAFEIVSFCEKNYCDLGDLDYRFYPATLNTLIQIPIPLLLQHLMQIKASY